MTSTDLTAQYQTLRAARLEAGVRMHDSEAALDAWRAAAAAVAAFETAHPQYAQPVVPTCGSCGRPSRRRWCGC